LAGKGPPPGSSDTEETTLRETRFCAIDLETTGLASTSRIVEVGAVKFSIGEEGEHFQTLVDPCCSIPHGAMRVHGISDEMVRGAPKAPEALEGLLEFSSGCVFVAHNARYDTSILTTELERAGIEFPPNDVICTIKASRTFLPKMSNYRLQTLAGALNIDPGTAHRALSDAIAAKQIFERSVASHPESDELRLSYVLERCSSARVGSSADEGDPAEVEEVRLAISDAIDCGASMLMMYGGGRKAPWPMQVKPVCVFAVRGASYLEAECTDGYTRSYRLDRILKIVSVGVGEP
jgi:DNA polymerase III epsilon subunit family exonuclease